MSRIANIVAMLLTLVLTTVVVLGVVVVVMISRGPISLSPLTSYLELAFEDQMRPFVVDIADTALSWDSEEDRIDLRVHDVRLRDQQGNVVLRLPQVAIALSATQAMSGRLAITTASLIRPQFNLLRTSDGELVLEQPSSGAQWPVSLQPSQGGTASVSLGRLQHVVIVGAQIAFADEATGINVLAPDATVELSVEGGALSGRVTTRLRFADSEVAVGAAFDYGSDERGLRAAIEVAELDLAALGSLFVGTPLAELRRAALVVGGTIDLSADARGGNALIAFDLSSAAGSIAAPEYFPEPLAVSVLNVKGQSRVDEAVVRIEQAEVELTRGLKAVYRGAILREQGVVGLNGEVTAEAFPVSLLREFWPEKLGPGARSWVMENILEGTIRNLKLALDLPPQVLATDNIPADAVILTWDFDGVTSTYLEDLPALKQGQGRGRVNGQRFDLEVSSATAAQALQVTEGRLAVPDFNLERPVLDIDFVVRGPAEAVLTLLSQPPLELPQEIGIAAGDVSGRTATAVRLTVPLVQSVTIDAVGYSAASTLTDVAMADVWNGWDLRDGQLTLKADDTGLRLQGEARANGIPMTLDWGRPIDGSKGPSTLHVKMLSDVAALRDFGFAPAEYASGAAGVDLQLEISDSAIAGTAIVDLTQAAVDLPAVRWSKEAGVPGRASVGLVLENRGGVSLRQLDVSAPGLEARADLSFDPSGRLTAAAFPRLALNGSVLALNVMLGSDGVYDVGIDGERLDLRPFDLGADDLSGDGESWPVEVRLNAALRQVVVSDGLVLSGVRANAMRGYDQWRNANISGVIAGEARASLVVRGVEDGYLLGFASSDAGVTARAFGVYDHAKDGRMQLQARILQRDREKPEIKGILRADDFVLVNAPLLARVMTLGSLRGINDAMSGNGIGFTRLELPFTMQGDAIVIQNGRAVGPALGLTGDVDINRSTDSVAASGTLIPAYTINSVLGRIPIIGDVLVGRRGEGVFALTFQIDGPVEEPRITVNPLSALAPGFLRRIVEGLEQPARPVDDDLLVPEPESFERRP